MFAEFFHKIRFKETSLAGNAMTNIRLSLAEDGQSLVVLARAADMMGNKILPLATAKAMNVAFTS